MNEPGLDFEELVEKAIEDPEFYKKLKKDPAAALSKYGFAAATPKQIEALKKINYDYLEEVAKSIGYLVT
jgi:hypothetical protein